MKTPDEIREHLKLKRERLKKVERLANKHNDADYWNEADQLENYIYALLWVLGETGVVD